MACKFEFRPGPPPYLQSNCPIESPPPHPSSPPSSPPPSSPPSSPPPPPPSTPPPPPLGPPPLGPPPLAFTGPLVTSAVISQGEDVYWNEGATINPSGTRYFWIDISKRSGQGITSILRYMDLATKAITDLATIQTGGTRVSRPTFLPGNDDFLVFSMAGSTYMIGTTPETAFYRQLSSLTLYGSDPNWSIGTADGTRLYVQVGGSDRMNHLLSGSALDGSDGTVGTCSGTNHPLFRGVARINLANCPLSAISNCGSQWDTSTGCDFTACSNYIAQTECDWNQEGNGFIQPGSGFALNDDETKLYMWAGGSHAGIHYMDLTATTYPAPVHLLQAMGYNQAALPTGAGSLYNWWPGSWDKWGFAAGKLYMIMRLCNNDIAGAPCSKGDVMEWSIDHDAGTASVTQRLIVGSDTFPGCCSDGYYDAKIFGLIVEPVAKAIYVYGDDATNLWAGYGSWYPGGDVGWLYKGVSA